MITIHILFDELASPALIIYAYVLNEMMFFINSYFTSSYISSDFNAKEIEFKAGCTSASKAFSIISIHALENKSQQRIKVKSFSEI